MSGRSERRWALMHHGQLLGVYCWNNGDPDKEPRTKTFRTRELARTFKSHCCYDDARVVSVTITVTCP